MRVYPVPDVLLHIALANELTHTIPPQAPDFSGHPLSYHYGMDVAVAMFANATRLNTRDLTLRFVPTLFLALSMLSVFCFRGVGFGQDISALSSCSWCFLAKISPSFPDCYWAKTLTGLFATSVCRPRFCPSSIRIQSFLDWVSFLRGCLVSSATCRSAAERGFSLLRCCLPR